MNQIKVMSFNLRLETDRDGINAFGFRKAGILQMLREERPEIIGFQEATDGMRRWLCEELHDYTVIGGGRNSDYAGEGTPVAFLTSAFELISLQTRWLSPTPEQAGSLYGGDHSHCPRMYLRLMLRHVNSGTLLTFVNTHTDHKGSRARLSETTQLIRDLGDCRGGHLVITGDFNAYPQTPEILQMTSGDPALGLRDASADVPTTFHAYGSKREAAKIDYIFTDLPHADTHIVERPVTEGVYLSDHHPLMSTLILPQKA